VNSGVLVSGQTYTVTFPTPGNFKLVCLVHIRMTGAVHVLQPGLRPFLMIRLSTTTRRRTGEPKMLSDASGLSGRGNSTAQRDSGNEVTAGTAAVG